MKLVEILAKHLDEWPQDVCYYVQDGDGEIKTGEEGSLTSVTFVSTGCGGIWDRGEDGSKDGTLRGFTPASDYDKSIVTKEMWIEEKRKMEEKEMTPCEKMGITEGDDVIVVVDENTLCEGIKAGDTITLIEDDGSDIPYFSGSDGHNFYVELAHVRKINPTPEDSINISVTYGELARAYIYMGATSGGDSSLWYSLRDILDPEGKIYNVFANQIKNSANPLDYACIKEDWLAALFPQKEEKVTEEQKKILELEETIKKAQQQIESIKENM